MKLSPLFGLPIAEPDDARRDFPTLVDEPRTLGLEAKIAGIGLAGYRVKVGNVVATTNVNGVVTIPFGVTFTSPPVVAITPGDAANIVASQNIALMQPNLTASQFMAAEFTKAAGQSVRLHYIAIGPYAALAREDGGADEPIISYEVMSDQDEPYPAPPDDVVVR